MTTLPPIELLKLTHTFPGPYTFKIIAEAKDGLIATLIMELKVALKWELDPKYSVRETAGGRHLALTLDAVMRTPEEVHTVYNFLKKVDGVILIL